MLILNLKTTKHSEHTPLSAYHLNSDTDYSQCLCVSLKIGKYRQIFYVITRKNGKKEKRVTINTSVSWFYSLNSWSHKD